MVSGVCDAVSFSVGRFKFQRNESIITDPFFEKNRDPIEPVPKKHSIIGFGYPRCADGRRRFRRINPPAQKHRPPDIIPHFCVYRQTFGQRMRLIFTCFLSFFLAKSLLAQQPRLSNFRSKIMDARLTSCQLDSLTIDPASFSAVDSATGRPVSNSIFTLSNSTLFIDNQRVINEFPDYKKLRVSYRVYPFNFQKSVFRIDTARLQPSNGRTPIAFDFAPFENSTSLFDTPGGIRYEGNYTRGISIGNAQNLTFNSNLNLQMGGKLGEDLELRAAISDNSIPIQPEGTTRQIQEFDRIFIQISRKNASLLAGDFDLGTRQGIATSQQSTANSLQAAGYFTRFFKKIQGAAVSSRWLSKSGFSKKDTLNLQAAIGLAKGKFSRQTLKISEGNQGPYRLQGAENERFIIVLAGSEKVWLDGELLRRGLEDDYIIDYNLGEIGFTSRRLINLASRVIVEFEYADQDFLRSTMAASGEWRFKKGRVFGTFYSEQDSKTAGSLQNLSSSERQILRNAGDDLRSAFASGIDTASFSADRILYKLADSTACGQAVDSILVWSVNADSAKFSARFTEVLMGQGDYILIQNNANGRVFKWVSPDPMSCERRGNFAPIIRLAAPAQLQLSTVGIDYQAVKNGRASVELALSRRDGNRFSEIGSSDDLGAALFSSWKQRLFPGGKKSGWEVGLNLNHELSGQFFQALNPYRPAEFSRDWNADRSQERAVENLGRAGFSLKKKEFGTAGYEFGLFSRAGQYEGRRHLANFLFQKNGWLLKSEASLLTTEGQIEQTKFFRPRADFSKVIKKMGGLRAGFGFEKERNERRPISQPDSLGAASFDFQIWKFQLQTNPEKERFRLGLNGSRRADFASNGTHFKKNLVSNELNINGLWQPATKNRVEWNLTTRDLSIVDSTLTKQAAQRTFLGRIDHSLTAWRSGFSSTTGYEIGSGQEPKIQYVYQKVEAGQGQFFWNDRNENGQITVDEIETPAFSDQANVLRFVLPTNDFVRTNNVGFNQSLRLDPRAAWQKPTDFQRFLNRFSTQSEWQVSRRTRAEAGGGAWNPFAELAADSLLVTVNSTIRNLFFLNRAAPRWDFQIEQKDNRSQLNLSSGFETRRLAEFGGRLRLTFQKKWTVFLAASQGQRVSKAQFLAGRDFQILYQKAEPSVAWQPNQKFRTTLRGRFSKSHNSLKINGEEARQADFSNETTWSFLKKKEGWLASSRLNGKVTFSKIEFTGQAATAIAYSMLEGLQPGKNWIWSLGIDRQIARNMQLNLSYEGRKTGSLRVVHVGRMQVRANF